MDAQNYITIAFISSIIGFLSISCEENQPGTIDNYEVNNIELTKSAKSLVEADNAFAFSIFDAVVQNEIESKNIFISPLSISLALAMTYNGAEGETKAAMKEALELNGLNTDAVNASYKSLIGALLSLDPKVQLSIANSIWHRNDFTINQDFIDVNQNYYNAMVEALDFSNPDAKNTINAWVDDKTNGQIPEIIDNIPGNAIMYLINAIYFKGIWKYKFEKSKTDIRPFFLSDGAQVDVPMMMQETSLNYFRNDTFSAVELPYADGEFSMVVILPHQSFLTKDIIENWSADKWNNLLNQFSGPRKVNLHLPSFKFEYKNRLNDELTDLGMGIAFGNQADFTGIYPNPALQISEVLHKTFIEVNEEGTEAAAVTSVEIIYTSIDPDQPVAFHVNRPFIALIKENSTGAILFMGQIVNPSLN